MKKNWPDIDVILITYNHEKFIAQAVKSILYQEYPGRIRVIVADDASHDATLDIIQSVAKQQSRLEFHFLESRDNLGITKNYQRAYSKICADYVAILEGDDYWSSTKKLLKQVEFLEENRAFSACGCNYFIQDSSQNSHDLRIPCTSGYTVVTPQILIRDNLIGNFSTCLYRKEALHSLPEKLFSATSYDWITNIFVAMYGPIGILGEPLSVYRVHGEGTWNQLEACKKLAAQHDIIPTYNELTDGIFSDEFDALRNRLLVEISRRSKTSAQISFLKKAVIGLSPPVLLGPLQVIYRRLFGGKQAAFSA